MVYDAEIEPKEEHACYELEFYPCESLASTDAFAYTSVDFSEERGM